jgi:hypothetical protein
MGGSEKGRAVTVLIGALNLQVPATRAYWAFPAGQKQLRTSPPGRQQRVCHPLLRFPMSFPLQPASNECQRLQPAVVEAQHAGRHMSASGSESIGSDDDDEEIGLLDADALLVSGTMSLLTGPHHGEILQVFTKSFALRAVDKLT